MKKLLCIVLLLSITLTSCVLMPQENGNHSSLNNYVITDIKETDTSEMGFLAVWFSYIELDFIGLSENDFKAKIHEMFTKVSELGFTAVICQVRSNCDAIYPSNYFPFSAAFTGTAGVAPDFDPLEIMIDTAHNLDLQFHAWINPYRISAKSKDYESLPTDSPAYKYLADEDSSNDQNVLFTDEGMYLNPASSEVRTLITQGINEILQNYTVDGIQFDDYFYPTTDPSFDEVSYNEYKDSVSKSLTLDDWRRTNVNLLLSQVYDIVHKNSDCVFGISPAADISDDKSDNNYTKHYADIYHWCSTTGYIDYIAPQLYFGYNYPDNNFRFEHLLKKWCDIPRAKNINIYIGLAAYKVGVLDADSNEWITNDNMLSTQVKDLYKAKVNGVLLYSYSYLFSRNEHNQKELSNLIKELK